MKKTTKPGELYEKMKKGTVKRKKAKKKGLIDSIKQGIKNVETKVGGKIRGKINELKEADKNFKNRPNNSNYYGSNKDFLYKKRK